MNGTRFTAVLALLVVLVAVLAGLDVVSPRSSTEPDLVTAEAARSGAWTCSIVGVSPTDPVHVTAAAAPSDEGAAAAVVIDQLVAGQVERIEPLGPFPGAAAGRDLEPMPEAVSESALVARWRRSPAVVARSWTRDASLGSTGTLAGPCIPATSPSWVIPGVSTAGGAEATLVLTNSFDVDASVQVTLATTQGRRQPALLENIVVPRRSVLSLRLNEFAPEERDLGMVVLTRSGRVVAEAIQSFDAAIGGIEGVSLVPGVAEPAELWTVPWAAAAPPPVDDDEESDADGDEDSDDEGTDEEDVTPVVELPLEAVAQPVALEGEPSGWLWVTNPSDAPATILVSVHTADGSVLTDLVDLTVVDPMSVARISLDGSLPDGVQQAAVTIAVEDAVPVAVVAVTAVTHDDAELSGLAVSGGAAKADGTWVVPAEPRVGRQRWLSIVNPGGDEAIVDVSLWTGQGILRPTALQGLSVTSGQHVLVSLDAFLEADLVDSAAFVVARSGAVVVGHVSRAAEDTLDLVAYPGIPSTVWSGGGLVSSTRFDPSLTNRANTGASDDRAEGVETVEAEGGADGA